MRNRAHVLCELIELHNLMTGAEIGVGSGPTTRALMERLPQFEWIGVDHWPAGFMLHPPSRGAITAADQARVRARYLLLVEEFAPRLRLIEKPSVEAASDIADGSLDIVFIDGDHTYEGCRADILAWRSKVRPGGWLTGHDYRWDAFPGVRQAVDELVPDPQIADDFVWLTRLLA